MDIGTLLESPVIVNTVLSILGLLASWLVARMLKAQTMTEQRRIALEALQAGVQHSWETFVRDVKLRSEDGKLDEADRVAARNLAKAQAIMIAKSQGVDLLKVVAAETIPDLIRRIIAARKDGA